MQITIRFYVLNAYIVKTLPLLNQANGLLHLKNVDDATASSVILIAMQSTLFRAYAHIILENIFYIYRRKSRNRFNLKVSCSPIKKWMLGLHYTQSVLIQKITLHAISLLFS